MVQLALPTFLASAAGTHSIIYDILPERMATIPYPAVKEGILPAFSVRMFSVITCPVAY